MDNFNQVPRSRKFSSPLMRKFVFLFVFIILLLIPLALVGDLIRDRGYLYKQTVAEVGNEWGGNQKIIAPTISIKYTDTWIDGSNKKFKEDRHFLILPEELEAVIEMKDEVRQRGIYKATVYNANIKLKGYFSTKDFPDKDIQAYLSIGLTDTKALLKINKFKLGNIEKDLEPISGTMATPLYANGISGEITPEYNAALKSDKIPFEIDIDFRGNRDISILPLGKKNIFVIKSNWLSPSFSGILPNERTIDENGFSATWNISNLIRNYPQIIDLDNNPSFSDFRQEEYDSYSYKYDDYTDTYSTESAIPKVSLFDPVTNYTQVYRACKYGILFITMSLIIVYIFEIASKKVAHYVQYGVVGFSLVIFYLLLLSLSEHLGFEWSYLISTLAIVIPNSLYITSMTSNKKFGIGMFIFLSGIYAILFSILRMEQYALLTGTLLILVVLYVVMYLTKKADIFLAFENKE